MKLIINNNRKITLAIAALAVTFAVGFSGVASSQTLEAVKKRGILNCIVSTGLAGFAAKDDKGDWHGFDADYCRAVAAAVLGDAKKVKFIPSTTKVRFELLKSGEGDVLSRNSTWTFTRDNNLGIDFVATSYYDGQGFIVWKKLGVKSAKELDGATVCVQPGTTTELNLADYFRQHGIKYEQVLVENFEESVKVYDSGRCDVYTTDASGLAAMRNAQLANPDDHVILPEIISREPLALAVKEGDAQWADIVRWVFFATVNAELLGVNSKNVEKLAAKPGKDTEINRMLGTEGELAAMLGLDKDFVVRVISQVGNYSEIFHSNLDALALPRSQNALYTNGGLHYSPPFR